jgi:hypothetical protein
MSISITPVSYGTAVSNKSYCGLDNLLLTAVSLMAAPQEQHVIEPTGNGSIGWTGVISSHQHLQPKARRRSHPKFGLSSSLCT